jgi:hypothetical protein
MQTLLAAATAAAVGSAAAATTAAGNMRDEAHAAHNDSFKGAHPAVRTPDLTALQAVVDAKSLQYNISISVGVMHPVYGGFGAAGGYADSVGGVKATVDSRYDTAVDARPHSPSLFSSSCCARKRCCPLPRCADNCVRAAHSFGL